MQFKEALTELRKEENKRKFDQTIDLIVNLKGIDVKKDTIAIVIDIPHKIKDKKVCGFLTKKNELIETVTEPDFAKYKDKTALKNLVKKYDFFVAAAPLMPKVATTFGKVLGPMGKMPSPQLGILTQENDSSVKEVLGKIEKSVKIRAKESSIKLAVGSEKMSDEQILENVDKLYNGIVAALPIKKDNVKSVLLKLTMTKPVKVEI
tara:strand:- start:1734 stop:2351 length:618 start_codon:yes stop_codon:yes gene_type:complete